MDDMFWLRMYQNCKNFPGGACPQTSLDWMGFMCAHPFVSATPHQSQTSLLMATAPSRRTSYVTIVLHKQEAHFARPLLYPIWLSFITAIYDYACYVLNMYGCMYST